MRIGVKGKKDPEPEVPVEAKKRTRETFLYTEGEGDEYAQCGTCISFTGQRCLILGPDFKVDADDSCNLYAEGEPLKQLAGKEQTCLTPEEAGFVDRKVRCEHCASFDGKGICEFFVALNDKLPRLFDLQIDVDPYGCCTANKPKAKT